ncbi:MAG TPA: 16S rRNA (cytidine(1402)-2'-O)-methyltransferase [Nitrospinaceae bacterium]|mgnify:FL=1|jgi:16S rRNA (cytidine1402-2'-O)-methyltransferase|nr:16S rRNA (cytidine(1402)-2'-O)-methyltransferase [Nitrospinaceae bacterium]HIB44342.1 16S rRNA (cytidine(1402)-2'-O)-methyltransferase [Nitrospina sp.]HIN88213.1 16S rRNA (cytidine(1402)-2'-O)-methyltransferase [Nitrospinaceae bacterium]|tara:strand:- start:1360 stop:2079 length:720 start_codon:yes stop_codon:yes gene_type:complete
MGDKEGAAEMTGTLYIVSTPIGNLKDATYRSLELLSDVDLIAAEDTRRTGVLLKHYEIKTPLTSFNSYNQAKKSDRLIARLKEGHNLALVSDAGTPGVSDPLYHLVRAALAEYVSVVSLPGPSAVLAALTISGLPVNRFVFEGFLPRKKGRKKLIEDLVQEKRTIVLFESPHRIAKTLNELYQAMGDRKAVLARELTKIHEEVIRGTLEDLAVVAEEQKLKGEITLVISGVPRDRNRGN